jgi:hypothetical protein
VAVETQESAVESGEHVVQFYEHDAKLLEAATASGKVVWAGISYAVSAGGSRSSGA